MMLLTCERPFQTITASDFVTAMSESWGVVALLCPPDCCYAMSGVHHASDQPTRCHSPQNHRGGCKCGPQRLARHVCCLLASCHNPNRCRWTASGTKAGAIMSKKQTFCPLQAWLCAPVGCGASGCQGQTPPSQLAQHQSPSCLPGRSSRTSWVCFTKSMLHGKLVTMNICLLGSGSILLSG